MLTSQHCSHAHQSTDNQSEHRSCGLKGKRPNNLTQLFLFQKVSIVKPGFNRLNNSNLNKTGSEGLVFIFYLELWFQSGLLKQMRILERLLVTKHETSHICDVILRCYQCVWVFVRFHSQRGCLIVGGLMLNARPAHFLGNLDSVSRFFIFI